MSFDGLAALRLPFDRALWLQLWPDRLSGGPIARIEKDVPSILDLEDADLVVERVPVLVEPEMLEGKLQVGFGKGGADCLPLGRY